MKKELLVRKSTTIKEAMDILGRVNPKVLFVADKKELIGTLTDGDLRRYLLAKGNIEDFVINACNKTPVVASCLEEAKSEYFKHHLPIPIIKNSKISDIYTGIDNEKKYDTISIPVVINAGGKGTRLEPFTKVLPKPLIPIGDYPIIEHIIQRFEKFGCNEFYSIVNYKKQLIKAYFHETDNKHNIECIDEDIPLGTVGGLSLLKDKIKGTFFFVNCDTLLLSNYSDILYEHYKRNSDLTMVCAKKEIKIPFGVVKSKRNKEYITMVEKPSFSFDTNIGFYIINKTIIDDLQYNNKVDMPELIEIEKNKGRKILVFLVEEEEWLDMGQLPELEKMRIRLCGK